PAPRRRPALVRQDVPLGRKTSRRQQLRYFALHRVQRRRTGSVIKVEKHVDEWHVRGNQGGGQAERKSGERTGNPAHRASSKKWNAGYLTMGSRDDGNTINLDANIARQPRHFNRRARRQTLAEVASID